MTGFRLSFGGAQQLYGIRPDMTTIGKIVGGGLPIAAYGGRADIMNKVAPVGPVYQAGTLSGNPLAVAAGLQTLALLAKPGTYERLEALGAQLEAGLRTALATMQTPACVNRVGSMWTVFFGASVVRDAPTARACHTELYARSVSYTHLTLPTIYSV